MLEQNGDRGPLWESMWLLLSAFNVTRVRVTAKSFNNAKKYGRHAELFFFLLQNMRRETDPIEPGRQVSTEPAIFRFPSLGWQTCVSPLEVNLFARRHSKGFRGSVRGPNGAEAGPAPVVIISDFLCLKVSSQSSSSLRIGARRCPLKTQRPCSAAPAGLVGMPSQLQNVVSGQALRRWLVGLRLALGGR